MIICCACNGGLQGREYNAAIPETPQEIAEAVAGVYEAGASMVHVHARDPGYLPGPAKRVEDWREVNDRIRERCPDIIINNTTGAGPGMTDEERLASLDVQPEMASLNLVPDMSRFALKERAAPLPHPRPRFEYDDCWPVSDKLVTLVRHRDERARYQARARDLPPGRRVGDPCSDRPGARREAGTGSRR